MYTAEEVKKWKKAVKAIRESKGTAETVTDEEIVNMQKTLARLEGIGVEPASASSLAGLKKLVEHGIVNGDERVVCITTGHMLKDPQEAIEIAEPLKEFDADINKIREYIHGKQKGKRVVQVKTA